MKPTFLLFLFPILLLSCLARNKGPIDAQSIQGIVILAYDSVNAKESNKSIIKDSSSLMLLIKKLNDCKAMPLVFFPTHKLMLSYSSGEEEMVYCSGSSMRYKGHTYEMTENIKRIVSSLHL